MPVDRLSVTVPSELGAALRALAKSRGETVSTIVTEAIEHRVRLAALARTLADADRQFGPVPPAMIDQAEAELLAARRTKPRKRTR